MSRSARLFAPGSLQHVCSHLLRRDGWLLSDAERARYLDMFGRALERSDWKCFAYCLMTSELHFAMVAGEQPFYSWSKRVNVGFAQFLNKRHRWSGPLFAARPTSREIAADHALDLVAYLHNHPVREQVAPDAAASSWSSHQAYVGLNARPRWLDVEEGLRRSGFARQSELFDQTVGRLADEQPLVPYSPSPTIGDNARHEVSGPHILEIVADELGLTMAALRRRHMRGASADAKSIAAHAARAVGTPLTEMANALGITRQRASQLAALELAPQHRHIVDRIVERLDLPVSLPGLR